jgi:hypothetical protein
VEHGGFEPPTPCLPAKWSSVFWLRQRHFPSHRRHAYSIRCASLRRSLSGSVVNPVVNFRPGRRCRVVTPSCRPVPDSAFEIEVGAADGVVILAPRAR